MRIGASIWPLRMDSPYEAAIRRIAANGFKALELIAWDRETLDSYYTSAEIKKLKDVITSEGLELSQFVSTPAGMASAQKAVRDQAVDDFQRMVEVAVGLGTKMVNTVSSPPFDIEPPPIMERHRMQQFGLDYAAGLDWKQNWDDYVDVIRRCCKICAGAGLRYSMEALPFCYVANTASMLRMIDAVGSSTLGVNFDPSHLFPMGEIPNAAIYQLAGRIFHCHFSDNDGVTNAHWRPGQGKIDWTAVMKALRDTGFDDVISIELEDAPGVSRRGHGDAADSFMQETTMGADYVREICERLEIPLT